MGYSTIQPHQVSISEFVSAGGDKDRILGINTVKNRNLILIQNGGNSKSLKNIFAKYIEPLLYRDLVNGLLATICTLSQYIMQYLKFANNLLKTKLPFVFIFKFF